MITDSMIMQESIRLVDEGLCVTLPVNGQSMLPFIIGGKESVVLSRPVNIKAVVTHVVNAKGQMHPLYTCRRQLAVHLWYWLLPIRRYLLTIYKKLL